MWHPFPGFSGSLASVGGFCAMWIFRRAVKKHPAYNLGPGGDPYKYEPIMNRYIRLSEFMIGAASGSIVLIVGSSALHGNGGKLAWFYASPLLLIAASVVNGIAFMACRVLTYENVLHGNPHTATNYALNEALGFSALICFVVGYIWLILAVTNLQ